MLWYGKKPYLGKRNVFSRNSFWFNKTRCKTKLSPKRLFSRLFLIVYVYIPYNWGGMVLEKEKGLKRITLLYLYSSIYYFKLLVGYNTRSIYFSYDSSILSLQCSYYGGGYSSFLKTLYSTFLIFNRVWFLKLKVKGKGYYLYKNFRNTFTYQFGHSHRLFVYAYFLSIRFLSKTTVLFFGLSKRDLVSIGYIVFYLKPLNIFTSRGVRFAKQVIYKKTGKVSSYR